MFLSLSSLLERKKKKAAGKLALRERETERRGLMGATEEELARLSVEEFEVAADADAETTTTTTSGEGEGTRRHRPTVSDLLKCQFHVWYPKFGPKYAGKVQTLELEQAFLDYLKQDGISVPENSRAVSGLLCSFDTRSL